MVNLTGNLDMISMLWYNLCNDNEYEVYFELEASRMKRFAVLCVFVFLLGMLSACSDEKPRNTEIRYAVTPEGQISQRMENEEFVIYSEHYQNAEGDWVCGEYTYDFRLEITGRMPNAAKNSTYIVLSNTQDITFDETWPASGLSSNLSDYIDPSQSVIVGFRLFS